jgi:galactose mutarotase-like enzyme
MVEYIQGWKAEVLENDFLKVSVIPELGAKIAQIKDKHANYDWLWEDPTRPLRARQETDKYDEHDISGFDECFPNIGISSYPGDPTLILPDHGELWSQSWSCEKTNDSIISAARGKVLPYTFERKITLKNRSLVFSYVIENTGQGSFKGFWSAHPLFNAVEGMQILLNGNPPMTKEFGFSGRMGSDGADGYAGHLDKYTWPHTAGESGRIYDLSQVTLAEPLTDKVVVSAPDDGVVTLLNPRHNCSVRFLLNPQEIPYVGMCFNLDAWPFMGEKARWVAIEPSTGPTDKLDESDRMSDIPIFSVNRPVTLAFTLTFNSDL